MTIGLKDETIQKIHEIFCGYPQIEQVLIYGSRAKGNYKPASDIDLTFQGKNITLKVLHKIGWQLDDLMLPYTFDLSIYHHIKNQDLLNHIDRVGIVFFKKEVPDFTKP